MLGPPSRWVEPPSTTTDTDMKLHPIVLLAVLPFAFAACNKEQVEGARDSAAQAAESTKEAAKEAGEAASEALQKAADTTSDAAKAAAEKTAEGLDKAADALRDAASEE